MKKATIIGAAALLLYCSWTPSRAAQDSISGDWVGRVKETLTGTKLWLMLNSNSEQKARRFNLSFEVPLQEVSGLNPNSPSSQVSFTLPREAGTLVFDGLFKDGKGVGDFRFLASGSFVSALRNLGYDNLSTDRLFSMAVHDLNTNFINELKSLGYPNLPVDKLIAMRIHRVDGKFIREMRALGYNNLSVDELMKLRIHGVDADFVRKVKGRQ